MGGPLALAVRFDIRLVDEDQPVPMDVMHRANTTRLCKQHGLYLAPNLNDRLYLQASAREL